METVKIEIDAEYLFRALANHKGLSEALMREIKLRSEAELEVAKLKTLLNARENFNATSI